MKYIFLTTILFCLLLKSPGIKAGYFDNHESFDEKGEKTTKYLYTWSMDEFPIKVCVSPELSETVKEHVYYSFNRWMSRYADFRAQVVKQLPDNHTMLLPSEKLFALSDYYFRSGPHVRVDMKDLSAETTENRHSTFFANLQPNYYNHR